MGRTPATQQFVSLLGLFLVAAFGLSAATQSRHRSHRYRGVPTYADPTQGDDAANDDPIVREIAVDALGHANGSVVAVDPESGRVLTIVNQKLAFSSGFEPCSTIKPVIALGGLQEGVITRNTMIRVAPRHYMDLTEAMAHSNNKYFAEVGTRLGFERVIKYAQLMGLGQRAGYDIPGEPSGELPSAPPVIGGIGRMSSFGSGIRITPFQLASMVSTLANGGTEYYLQYPRTPQERADFTPRVRRHLDISGVVPDIREGMLAAVLYGTAKQSYDPDGEQALGKTGTCNDEDLGGRIGWFASYADQMHPKIVLVVLIRGGSRYVTGPHASEIAGRIYRTLHDRNFFATEPRRGYDDYVSSVGASH